MAKAKEVKTDLSRKDMERVIKGGGSVLYGGEIITSVKGLPDEADLAETDEQLAAAAAKIEEEEKTVAAKKAKVETKTASRSSSKSSSKKSNK
jgi:hypothetical protein